MWKYYADYPWVRWIVNILGGLFVVYLLFCALGFSLFFPPTRSTATEAKDLATTAKSTADTAKSTADTAKTAADEAKGEATKAKSKAEEALKEAKKVSAPLLTSVVLPRPPKPTPIIPVPAPTMSAPAIPPVPKSTRLSVDRLTELLADPDDKVAEESKIELVSRGTEAIKSLVQTWDSPCSKVRRRAYSALMAIGGEASANAAIDALTSTKELTRRIARWFLLHLGDDAKRPLADHIFDPNPQVRVAVKEILQKLSEENPYEEYPKPPSPKPLTRAEEEARIREAVKAYLDSAPHKEEILNALRKSVGDEAKSLLGPLAVKAVNEQKERLAAYVLSTLPKNTSLTATDVYRIVNEVLRAPFPCCGR